MPDIVVKDANSHTIRGPKATVRMVGSRPMDEIFSCSHLGISINITRIREVISAKSKKYKLVRVPCDETALAQTMDGYSGIDETHSGNMPLDVLKTPGIVVNIRGRVLLIDGYHRLHQISRQRLAKWFPCYELTVGQVRHFAIRMFVTEPGSDGPWTEVPATILASSDRTKTQQIHNLSNLLADPKIRQQIGG